MIPGSGSIDGLELAERGAAMRRAERQMRNGECCDGCDVNEQSWRRGFLFFTFDDIEDSGKQLLRVGVGGFAGVVAVVLFENLFVGEFDAEPADACGETVGGAA